MEGTKEMGFGCEGEVSFRNGEALGGDEVMSVCRVLSNGARGCRATEGEYRRLRYPRKLAGFS